MRVIVTIVSLLGLATMALAFATSQGGTELKAGDAAPSFSLPGSDGRTYSLDQFRGKKAVVIAWFPKAFTGGWTAECKSLRESGADLKQFDVAYFAASVDTPDTNKKFAQSLELDYPILSDPGKQVARAYGVITGDRPFASRWTFYIGKDGRILHVDTKVSTSSHGKDVVARLQELGIPKNR